MPATQYGVNSSSPASPGISGAIKDAVGAIAKYVSPRSVKSGSQKADEDSAINSESSGDEPTRLPGHEVDPDGS